MTTYNYIDIGMHLGTLPATYVPPANLVAASAAQSSGTTLTPANASTYLLAGNPARLPGDGVSGYFTSANNAVVIPVGFIPTRVEIINWTDTKKFDWMRGAPATDTLYDVASADPTVDTGTAILVTADGSGGLGNTAIVTLSATAVGSSKTISYRISA